MYDLLLYSLSRYARSDEIGIGIEVILVQICSNTHLHARNPILALPLSSPRVRLKHVLDAKRPAIGAVYVSNTSPDDLSG